MSILIYRIIIAKLCHVWYNVRMDNGNNYFLQRQLNTEAKITEIISILPAFTEEFFVGIQAVTSPLTRLGYARDLQIFFDFLYHNIEKFKHLNSFDFTINNLKQVNSFDIEKFLSYLSGFVYKGRQYVNSQITKSRKLACIKSMFKYFYNKNLLDSDAASKVKMPKVNEKPIIRLDNQETFDIIELVENGDNGLTARQKAYYKKTKYRDIAIITLFLGTGIRISELVGLNIDDFDFANSAFKITRKGGNQTILYYNNDVSIAVQDYISIRSNDKIDLNEKALFLSLQNKRITVRAVELLVKKYTSIIAPLKNISPHKLRSTFGTNLYRETKDIYVVAELLGHKDINITKKHYADISEDIKKSASNKVNLRDVNNK